MSNFRPLHKELRIPGEIITAGLHDIDKASISLDGVGDMIVMNHEMQHDTALNETNYGFIQTVFRIVYERTKIKTVRESSAQWSSILYEESCLSHEVHATYLSIKSLPSHIEKLAVEELPEEYKGYFNTLALLIDEVLPSTYLQFMVGKVMMEICLSSLLIDKMQKWDPEKPVRLDDEDSPDKRLKRLIPVWSKKLPQLRELLSKKCPERKFYKHLPDSFNILSEQHWASLSFEVSQLIDDWLEVICRSWMYPISESVVPCSSRSSWFEQRKLLVEHISKFSGFPFEMAGTKDNFYAESDLERIKRRAWRAGRTIISNPIPSLIKLPRLNQERMLQSLGLGCSKNDSKIMQSPLSKCDRVIFISEQPGIDRKENSLWGMFKFRGNKCIEANTIYHGACMNLCRIGISSAATTGFSFIGKLQFIVGLWSTQTHIDTSLVKELVKAYSVGPKRVSLQNTIWYMAGDFYHFYEFLVAQGGLEGFYTNPFDSDPEFESKYSKMSFESLYNVVQNISKEDLNKNFKRFARGPIWYIFRSPIIEGLFLKITIPHSEVLVAIAEDINSGKIRLFDKSEMEETWNGISHVNIPIFTSWKQL